MSMIKRFTPAPSFRPALNLGCLFDIPTGVYLLGKHGESILNGGLSYLTGISGRGNTYKSTIEHFMELICMSRHTHIEASVYDTEVSLSIQRMIRLSSGMENITKATFEGESTRFLLTSKSEIVGDAWFEETRQGLKERVKDKSQHGTLPMVDSSGEYVKALVPFISGVDSLSQMDISSVDEMYDKATIGNSKLNTEALKGAAAKSQMMSRLPGVTSSGGCYMILTAHLGDVHQLDPYAPPTKKLGFLKGKASFKRVPENFTFLTNNCWLCLSAVVLNNQTTKSPEYPRSPQDDTKGETDLMLITLQNLRAKSGPSGLPMTIVISQSDGVHVGLTEFHHIKVTGRFGLGGNDRSYFLDLVPDVNLSRTTVRSKINESAKLRRALEITSEMCQIKNMWHHLPSKYSVTPADLYKNLIEQGYDWDILLNTRGYYKFLEDTKPTDLPFLSTMDLLRMYTGEYKPYWYDKVKGVTKGK